MLSQSKKLTGHLQNTFNYIDCWDEDPDKRPTIEFVLKTLNQITWITKTNQALDTSKTPVDQHVENSISISLPASESIENFNLYLSSPLPSSMTEIDQTEEFLEKMTF